MNLLLIALQDKPGSGRSSRITSALEDVDGIEMRERSARPVDVLNDDSGRRHPVCSLECCLLFSYLVRRPTECNFFCKWWIFVVVFVGCRPYTVVLYSDSRSFCGSSRIHTFLLSPL
jgi:hypothetical protein